jgi:hypothetical protein
MSLKAKILIFVVVVIFGAAFEANAQCRTIQPMANFNASLFAGRWYEKLRYTTAFNVFGRCASLNVTRNSANNITLGFNSFVAFQPISFRNSALVKSNGVINFRAKFILGKVLKSSLRNYK